MKKQLLKILPYTILLISISSILPWCSLPISNTFLWWLLNSIILFAFFYLAPKHYSIFPIKIFLIYVGFSAIYGAIYMTENYWDWKLLVNNLMVFLLPIAVYIFSNANLLQKVLQFWLKYAWILLIILTPFLSSDAFGRFLVPYSFLSLFIFFVNRKNKIILIIAYLVTITFGYASRSDVLKFTVCILIGGTLYFPIIRRFFYSFRRKILYLLWLTPIMLFVLGITGVFNVFQIEKELGLEGKFELTSSTSDNKYSALIDTRTFLYQEEIKSAIKHNYVIQGRSIARGYESYSFGKSIDKALNIQRGERQSCETSILNVFNYFGIIGVILYFIIFVTASYKGVTQSHNLFVPLIGIYVAFRWLFAWIEDFSRFDLNYLFLWTMIGICYSPQFRSMSNKDFYIWLRTLTKY